MKVLVTGASGFLGRAVTEALVRHGHTVRALTRSRPDPASVAAGVEPWLADLRVADLAPALAGIDAVVHGAAVLAGDVMEQFQGTVLPTERLLEAMVRVGPRRLVLVSSFSVYDWTAAVGELHERSALEPRLEKRDGYTVAKIWQERLCRRYAEAEGLCLSVLRPGFIWSDERRWVAGAGIRLGGTLVVNGPLRRLPLTHVENCADCVALSVSAEAANGETINVVDSDSTRAWHYAGALVRDPATGIARRIALPYHLGLLVAWVASAGARVLFGPRARLPGLLAPHRYRARFRSLRFPNAKAARLLAWKPRVHVGSPPGPP